MLKFSDWLIKKKISFLEHSINIDGTPFHISDLSIIAPKNSDILDYAISKYINSMFPASNPTQRFVNTLRHNLTNYDTIFREIDKKMPEGGAHSCSRLCAMYNLDEMCLHLIKDMCHQFDEILSSKGEFSIILPKVDKFSMPPAEIETSEIIDEALRQKCLKENVLTNRWIGYNCNEKLPNIYKCPTSRPTPKSHDCLGKEDEEEDYKKYRKGYR
jgi:hypothetical protein